MSIHFLLADKETTLSAKLGGIQGKAEAKFKITKAADNSVVADLAGELKGGKATCKWTPAAPPADGDASAWRGSFQVTVTPEEGKPLEAASQEFEVYLDWLEVEAVDADGKALEGALFDVVVGGKKVKKKQKTGKDGKLKVEKLPPGAPAVEWLSPFVLVKWDDEKGPKRKATLRVVRKAKFVWPAVKGKSGKHKQWVNLAVDNAKPEQGSKLKVKVTLEGGKKGDKVFLKAVWDPAKVSARNDPKREVVGAPTPLPAWAPQGGKEVTLSADGKEEEVELELGVAGRDVIQVKLGGTDKCDDVTLEVETARKVWLEVLQPKDTCTSFTTFKKGAAGLDDKAWKALKAEMTPVGIELASIKEHFFDKANLEHSGDPYVLDGPYFGKKAGTKVTMLTSAQFARLRDNVASHFTDQRAIVTVWADYIAKAETFRHSVMVATSNRNDTHAITAPQGIFKLDPATGGLGVKSMRWRATEYDNAGVWTPISAGDPGDGKTAWQNVDVSTQAKIDAQLELVTWRGFKLKLPTAGANDPGNFLVDAASGAGLLLEVEVEFNGAKFTTNGMGWHGYLYMSTWAGNFKTGGLCHTLLHEIGHNIGMAYADKTVDPTYGRNAPNAIPGVAFPTGVAVGLVYGGHDHTGTHCAAGLSAAQRGLASFAGLSGSAKCIMFGENDMASSKSSVFDETCRTFLRASDCADVHKAWEA